MTQRKDSARTVCLIIARIYATLSTAAVVIYALVNFAFPFMGEALRGGIGFAGWLYRVFSAPVTVLSNSFAANGFVTLLGDTVFMIWSFVLIILLVVPAFHVTFCVVIWRRYANPAFWAFFIFYVIEIGFGVYLIASSVQNGGYVPLMGAFLAVKVIGALIMLVWIVRFRRYDSPEKVYIGTDGIKHANPDLFR